MSRFGSTLPFIIVCATTILLLVDISMNGIYYRSVTQWPLYTNIVLFITIGIFALTNQFLLMHIINKKTSRVTNTSVLRLELLQKVTNIIIYSIAAMYLIIIVQMALEQRYITLMLTTIVGINAFSSLLMMVHLAVKFFSWFKRDKNVAVALYGFSSAIIAITIAFGGFVTLNYLRYEQTVIHTDMGILFPYSEPSLLKDLSETGYEFSLIAAFLVSWISTLFLLKQYSVRWRGKVHWAIVIAPLVYFVFSSQPLFTRLFAPLISEEPVLYSIVYTLFITYSKPVGGFVFGAAFWAITKTLSRQSITLDFTTISAYGFVLLFIANNLPILSSAPYPPFGLATVSFLGLSCYMVVVGIYSSVISISQDTKLRRSIRKLVEKKSNLLDSISVSEMTQSLERDTQEIYNTIARDALDTSTPPPALSPEDARDYCNEVLDEMKKSKYLRDKV